MKDKSWAGGMGEVIRGTGRMAEKELLERRKDNEER
jgi:hypothetical protein